MEGDKGTCSAGKHPNVVRKTKFNTKENAKKGYHSLVNIGVIAPNYEIYLCKECDRWHFGKPEHANLYKK